ncbi:hypothetical protein Nepgr_029003 [Nepenthes gracilis]|uniref:Uncharacterized protein n=1 Tax=Nepenthes gracilis TaxID=150966 RepID=A0AAD3TCS3_NEPGR|nr:hypothetical protein Nepgr_029003 [Nepenthes gracilis]
MDNGRQGSEDMDLNTERCRTPTCDGCRIPATLVCPPPPRKKKAYSKNPDPPKNGYFQPPYFETVFFPPHRTEASGRLCPRC